MQIDLTNLIINKSSSIMIDNIVNISDNLLENSLIDELNNVYLKGRITVNEDDEFVLTGVLSGVMKLKDDITLEPVMYEFSTEIEENLDKFQKTLDITEILWQNILVEIPSKVRTTSEDVELSGDGWRVISEERFNEERNKLNNPFSNLDKLLDIKEDK